MVNTVQLGVVEVCTDWWCGDVGERIIMVLLKSLQEMGEKDKEENPTPAGIYSKESVGKVT